MQFATYRHTGTPSCVPGRTVLARCAESPCERNDRAGSIERRKVWRGNARFSIAPRCWKTLADISVSASGSRETDLISAQMWHEVHFDARFRVVFISTVMSPRTKKRRREQGRSISKKTFRASASKILTRGTLGIPPAPSPSSFVEDLNAWA